MSYPDFTIPGYVNFSNEIICQAIFHTKVFKVKSIKAVYPFRCTDPEIPQAILVNIVYERLVQTLPYCCTA